MTSIGSASGTAAFYDTNIASMNALRASTDALQAQISTGNKVQSATDDPLVAAQMRALALADTQGTADTATAAAAKTKLTLADSTLSQFSTIVTQIQTLATQAANGTLSDSDRADIGTQVSGLRDQLVSLANTQDASGHPLFGGQTGSGTAYTLDASGNATYTGTATSSALSLGNGMSVTAGVTGPEVLSFKVGGTQTDLLSVVKSLADSLQAGGTTAATTATSSLASLTAGLNAITAAQTTVGARLSWVATAGAIQTQASTQRQTDEANIGGTDIATAVSRLQQQMTVLQASQASFVKMSSLSLFSLLS